MEEARGVLATFLRLGNETTREESERGPNPKPAHGIGIAALALGSSAHRERKQGPLLYDFHKTGSPHQSLWCLGFPCLLCSPAFQFRRMWRARATPRLPTGTGRGGHALRPPPRLVTAFWILLPSDGLAPVLRRGVGSPVFLLLGLVISIHQTVLHWREKEKEKTVRYCSGVIQELQN